MTNPHTNLAGCYEISITQAANETGYNKESIERLLKRMEEVHNTIRYSKSTKEVLILNWSKYNWTRSRDFQKPLLLEIENVKNLDFKTYLELELEKINTVLTPSNESLNTSVTVTDTVSDTVSDTDIEKMKEIINYLNEVTGSRYKANTDKTKRTIHARLAEGFTVDDFKAVIDKKNQDWKGTEWEKYLRPETLFGTKFEGYLNQKIKRQANTGVASIKI
jgi:uncharacterized phage protein (TIGR02220 family)